MPLRVDLDRRKSQTRASTARDVLRRARDADAERIAALHIASWRATYARELSARFLASQTLEEWAARWRSQIADGVAVMVTSETGDEPLRGFVACGPARTMSDSSGAWEIYNIHVAPDQHGKGIGSMLFNGATDLARQQGARQLALWVVETNDNARAFYTAKGMRLDGGKGTDSFQNETLYEVRYRIDL